VNKTTQAITTLAQNLRGVTAQVLSRGEHKGRVRLEVTSKGEPDFGPRHLTPARALGTLAWLAYHHKNAQAIRETVGWHGPIPIKGISAWEESALIWLSEEG
jgi:hypothetical protein